MHLVLFPVPLQRPLLRPHVGGRRLDLGTVRLLPAPGASTPQFATLTSNGSLFFPTGFDAAAQPFPVFRPPFALDAAGGFDAPRGGGRVNGVWFTAVGVSRCPRAAARGRGRGVVRCCGPQRKDGLPPLEG